MISFNLAQFRKQGITLVKIYWTDLGNECYSKRNPITDKYDVFD